MRFIKENVFLVVLVSVTVLAAAALVFLGRKCAAEAKKSAAMRTDLSGKLSNFARGAYVNPAVLDEEQNRVRATRGAVGDAKGDMIRRNRGNYRVMTFVADGKTHPAFPIDKELYARVGAEYKIAQKYQDEVEALLELLSPTQPPTEEEIAKEIRRVVPEGDAGMRPGVRLPSEVPARRPPTRPPGYVAGAPRIPRRRYPSRPPPGYVAGRGTTVEEEAEPTLEEIATEKFILAGALKGRIYASKDRSMYLALLSDQFRYSFEELWFAQVSLWVMRDIVEAVKLTNEQASSTGLGVPVSAVKRLVETDVLGYVVRQVGAPGRGRSVVGSSGPTYAMAGVPVAVPTAGGAQTGLQYFSGAVRRVSAGYVPRLTGKACCQLYDVVHYRFIVIMPARHLPRLCKNLMQQNYHTVIDVVVGATDRSQRIGSSQVSARRDKVGENRYYYGTDSVVEVTITGELLMLTDWARGRKEQPDPNTGVVVKGYPQLMPKQFLTRLAELDPEALRPEDRERVGPIGSTPGRVAGAGRRSPRAPGMR